MGVILDSSVIIRAERAREKPAFLIRRVIEAVGFQDIALSAIGYTELVHGTHRGSTNAHRILARTFLAEVVSELPVYNYTLAAAEIAGRIDADQRMRGLPIPFADLLIGATALSLGYGVLTANLRDFEKIPGLKVVSF